MSPVSLTLPLQLMIDSASAILAGLSKVQTVFQIALVILLLGPMESASATISSTMIMEFVSLSLLALPIPSGTRFPWLVNAKSKDKI